MNVKLVTDNDGEDYKLKSETDEEISSYSVERDKEKALISYETNVAFRNQGYASLGLNLLKSELFKGNHTLILELINLSGDYSRKVAEECWFLFPTQFYRLFCSIASICRRYYRKKYATI